MKILITGLEGFTGQYVQRELEAHGHRVVGLTSNLKNFEAISFEINDLRPDAVVHLAAISFVGHGDVNEFYQVNLIGTRNLLQALSMYASDLQCVLLASSANIYGNSSAGVIGESILPAPANDYAVSKLAMEYMSRTWMNRLPIIITRPFNYTGVGQGDLFLIPKIVKHFKENSKTIELGNINIWRDFSDVREVAKVYRRLLETKPLGETVNVCSGRMYSIKEILKIAEEITGIKIKINVKNELIRDNEVEKLCGDNSKLIHLIGGVDMSPLEDTLRWMLE